MSLESICLAQRSMLVEEALIGPLPFFQEQMSEMGLKTGKARCEHMFSVVHPTTDTVLNPQLGE